MKLALPLKLLASLLLVAGGLGASAPSMAGTLAYSANLVTTVRVGRHLYTNADLTLTFVGDSSNIAFVPDGSGNPIQTTLCSAGTWFYWLTKGSASFSLRSNGRTISGHFAAGQIVATLDACNGGIGLGSYTGPNGFEVAYPVGFTLGSAMTVALTSGLWSPANMSGNAWSCIGYPPNGSGNLSGNGFCLSPDAYPLHSDVGDVFVYQPYTSVSTSDGSMLGNHSGTLNRGTFSITPAGDE